MLKKLFLFLLLFITILQATIATRSNVTQLYVANFNRASDDAGLKYWVDNSKLLLEEIATSFYDQPETRNMYPSSFTNEEFVNAVYNNMFNRKPDDKGFEYWKRSLDDKLISRALFILAVVNGAKNDDESILDNKTIVGLEFADAGKNKVTDAYSIMQNITEDIKSVDSVLCEYDLSGCDSLETIPTLDNFIGSIVEIAEGWAKVGTIVIKSTGNKPIYEIILSGDGYKNFEVNTKGDIIVSIGADLNSTKNPLYSLKAVAINDLGDSDSVDVNISVISIDGSNTTPILDNSSGTVLENALIGDSIGAVIIKSIGSSPIINMTLNGDGSENFSVDNRGYITVASGSYFDYNTTSSYNLKVIAKNSSGDSNIADFKISVTKQGIEGSPILQASIGTVSENAEAGSRVGSIIVKSNGTSDITSLTLSGGGSSNFIVDTTTKIISVASDARFDYNNIPSYSLQAVATNSIGTSNSVTVAINVTNIGSSSVPILASSTGSVPENAIEGTVVGKIIITSSGESEIIKMSLSNFDKDSFTIDAEGNIKVSAYSHLDYEKYQSYSLTVTAINNQGESNPVPVIISIVDIPENNPILENSVGTIIENAEASTTVGLINIKSHGDSTIISFTLNGIGKDKFLVDTTGKITLKDSNSLDYEDISDYNLTVIASSEVGNSNSADIYIKVTNFSDVEPILQAFTGDIDENASIGDLVGTINIVSAGDSGITAIRLGDDTTSSFTVDTDGNIKVAKTLNFETTPNYIFSGVATNDAGDSDSVAINITVNDVNESKPTLGNTLGSVPENAEVGKKVADINITNDGGEAITLVILDGIGKDNFTVSLDGNISVATGSSLSYTNTPEYNLTVLVSNKIGISNTGNVNIMVTKEASLYPVLAPLSTSILETIKLDDEVGDINITSEGTSDILDITLSGDGSENFIVDREGFITLNTWKDLDYDIRPSYALKAIARNNSGNSNEVDINITLIKVDKIFPTIKGSIQFIDENITSNSIIGQVEITDNGDSPIISFELNGSNNEQFDINNSGSISVADGIEFDYDNGVQEFHLIVRAKNNSGYSNDANLIIYINNIPDINATLKAFTGNVEENATEFINLGQIEITQGDSEITDITLSGFGEGNFTIDTSGVIRLSPNANIDYESGVTDFTLKAVAINSSGTSQSVDVNLTIINILDIGPSIEGVALYIGEDLSIGSEIGAIKILSEGDGTISSFILDEDYNNDFNITKEGNIIVNHLLDYETQSEYYLIGYAQSNAGDSNRVDVNITITDISDLKPSLNDFIGNIDENASVGDIVGQIYIEYQGDSNISDINLSGNNIEYFSVKNNGDIILNHLLDYDNGIKEFNLTAIAFNSVGSSEQINVTISINNILDINATLTAFSGNIDENATDSMSLGQIDIIQGDSSITEITLNGIGEGNFTIDTNGVIKLSPNSNIDYESGVIEFTLKAVAINSSGTSQSVDVNLTLVDIPDVPPVLEDFNGNIDENTYIGTSVGIINILSIGDSNISSIDLSGDGSDYFNIDNDGNITLNKLLDYRIESEYNLTAVAINGAGSSEEVDVNITVNKDIDSFVTFWDTGIEANSNNSQLKIGINPNNDYIYNYSINWGDGSIDYNITTDITHTYSNEGEYRVKIGGVFPQLFSGNPYSIEQSYKDYDGRKLLRVEQWGTQKWESMSSSFSYCESFELNATDIPDLSQVKNMNTMFTNSSQFNTNIGNWNVSNIESMTNMFDSALKFNQSLNDWNISNVTNINYMFYQAKSFNQPLNDWNVSNIINMHSTFNGAVSFNQTLESWNIKTVTNMQNMLENTNLSVDNYSNTLDGWLKTAIIDQNITLDANNLKYNAVGESAKNDLTQSASYNWTINDGGLE